MSAKWTAPQKLESKSTFWGVLLWGNLVCILNEQGLRSIWMVHLESKALAKKHGIRLHQLVLNWGNVYNHKKHQDLPKKVHTLQDVLSFMKRTGASRAETALHINKPANNLKNGKVQLIGLFNIEIRCFLYKSRRIDPSYLSEILSPNSSNACLKSKTYGSGPC
jgi:hypothetical protein